MMNLKNTTYAITTDEVEEFRALRSFYAAATGDNSVGHSREEIMGQGYAHDCVPGAREPIHTSPAGEKWVLYSDGAEWVTPCGYKLEDFLSPVKLTPGYDTVLGYLAKTQPEVLMAIDERAEATQRDGFWLTHRADERGLPVCKVIAPKFLEDQGITEVNAYPLPLLAERFNA